jgi:hypothetical protein
VVARFGTLPLRNLSRFEEIDYAAQVLTDHVLSQLKPDVPLIWFNEPDTSYHYKFLGAPETVYVIRHVDAAFGVHIGQDLPPGRARLANTTRYGSGRSCLRDWPLPSPCWFAFLGVGLEPMVNPRATHHQS